MELSGGKVPIEPSQVFRFQGELDPEAAAAGEGVRAPLCRLEPLFALFDSAGLTGITLRSIDVAATFQNFDDFWGPFLAGQGPAPHYAMSLNPERRDALRERLEETLPAGHDGTITVPPRAWAIKGER